MRAKRYEYKGETKTLKEWAEEYGLKVKTLRKRINDGAELAAALETPIREREKRVDGHIVCPYPNCDDCPYPDCRW